MPSLHANGRGIIALIGSMAAYAISDVGTKLVARTYPFGETIAVRGLFTVIVVGLLLGIFGQWRTLPYACNKRVALRAVLDALSSTFYIAALVNMPIANAAALNMTHPLILVALSVLVLSEVVGWRRWSAVVAGFVGVLFIVKPTASAFNIFALAGLGAPLLGAFRELVTRRLDPTLPSMTITLASLTALTFVGGGIGIAEHWQPMGLREAGLLAIAACFFSLATGLVVHAFRTGEISAVAPFRYTFLIWAGVAGYVSFGELPDAWSILGAAMIAGSGLYALHREAVRQPAARQTGKSP